MQNFDLIFRGIILRQNYCKGPILSTSNLKKTELSFAADKELEYEFQNTLKIMDDFAS